MNGGDSTRVQRGGGRGPILWAALTLVIVPALGALLGYLTSGTPDAFVLAILGVGVVLALGALCMMTGLVGQLVCYRYRGFQAAQRTHWSTWLVQYAAVMGVIFFSCLLLGVTAAGLLSFIS